MMWRFCDTGLPTNSAFSGLKPPNTSLEWLKQLMWVPPSKPLLDETFWSEWNTDYGCRDSKKSACWIDGIVGNLTSEFDALGFEWKWISIVFTRGWLYLSSPEFFPFNHSTHHCHELLPFYFILFFIFKLLLCAWVLCTGCSHTCLTERMLLTVVLLGCRCTWTCNMTPHFLQRRPYRAKSRCSSRRIVPLRF